MSKRANRGFHTPFEQLKQAASAQTPPEQQRTPAPLAPPPSDPAPVHADDDATLFQQAMSGATPMTGRDAIQRPSPSTGVRAKVDEEALALAELHELVHGSGEFRMIGDSEEPHSGAAPGVNNDLLERLQKGEFAHRKHLDLHGLSRETAHQALIRFITESRKAGERCVLVVTGRGKRSPGGVSVLRETLPRWLSRAPLRAHVLAFSSALPIDGGPGAFYVLLRRAGTRPFGSL